MSGYRSGAGYGNHGGDEGFAGQDVAKDSDDKPDEETIGSDEKQPARSHGEPSEKPDG